MSSCLQCIDFEAEAPSPSRPFPVELSDDGILDSRCDRGHRTIFVVQSLRFELLFDFGILALQDGYHREAVTSFNASLERTYEFFLRDIAARSPELSAEFGRSWKLMSAMSERQFGAFAATYLLHTKQSWTPLSQKSVELRNDCVHKGYLPSRAEARDFGIACLETIWRAVDALRASYGDLLRRSPEFGERHKAAEAALKNGGGSLGSSAFASVIDLMHSTSRNASEVVDRALANQRLRYLYPTRD